jgi:putative colanic acid biosynthesis acetyltransferase WcaF
MRDIAPLKAKEGLGAFDGAPSFSLGHRLHRALWGLVWRLFGAWTPPPCRRWRIMLVRLFGGRISSTAAIYGGVRIWYPPNLTMHDYATLGPGANCYCMAPVEIGRFAVISQGAHLCTGTHDFRDPAFQIYARPIRVGDDAWICAEAFVGPGVTVEVGAVLGARAVSFVDLSAWTVYSGNPATVVSTRVPFVRRSA